MCPSASVPDLKHTVYPTPVLAGFRHDDSPMARTPAGLKAIDIVTSILLH